MTGNRKPKGGSIGGVEIPVGTYVLNETIDLANLDREQIAQKLTEILGVEIDANTDPKIS